MAYQTVATPRFYLNIIEWLISKGMAHNIFHGHTLKYNLKQSIRLFSTLPVDMQYYPNLASENGDSSHKINLLHPHHEDHPDVSSRLNMGLANYWGQEAPSIEVGNEAPRNGFICALGHGPELSIEVIVANYFSSSPSWDESIRNNINVNADFIQLSTEIVDEQVGKYPGFSIASFDNIPIGLSVFPYYGADDPEGFYLGSLILGQYYDLPHGVELELNINNEYDGITSIQTAGGTTLSDHKYSKSPAWGELGPWELGNFGLESKQLSRGGRRSWEIKCSHIMDTDLFPKHMLQDYYSTINDPNLESPPIPFSNSNETFSFSDKRNAQPHSQLMTGSKDFYSQVIQKTNGGQLPFIFQPDTSNYNSDSFSICKIDPKSFRFKQIANGIYEFDLKIHEVW